jgi:uncharacterized protein
MNPLFSLVNISIQFSNNIQMQPVNLRSFRAKSRINRRRFRRFLTFLEKKTPKKMDAAAVVADKIVWQEIDCLSCANCCKTMSPTFTPKDIRRISAHLGMTPLTFKDKYLYLDKRDKDWMNVKQPCQFLDLTTNKCSIYEVRPADCAGFPHHTKRKMVDYMHVYKQNVEYCPATYRMVELMISWAKGINVPESLQDTRRV